MVSAWSELFGDRPVVLDGGLSTQLEAHGHTVNDPLWTGRVLLQDPAAITQAHADFVHAGADVVISASYQVSRRGFEAAGLPSSAADEALVSSVAAARAATSGGDCRVAASVGPYGAILHDGSEYRGRYGLSHRELVDFHAERLDVLVSSAPDLLAVETIPDVEEAAALAEVLAEHAHLPAWMTFTAADDALTSAGQAIEDAVAAATSAPNVVAVGVNCTDPRHVTGLLHRMRAVTSLPIVIYPNAGGSWNPADGSWDDCARGPFAPALVEVWQQAGATAIGGCCGTDAAVISALADQLSR
jgi:homocysteine S-methyltransferase